MTAVSPKSGSRPALAVGQSVPVAFWVGPTAGAVMHIRRTVSDRNGEVVTEREVFQYRRVDGTWSLEMSSADHWLQDPPLARIPVPPGHVALDKKGESWGERGGSTARWGEVGTDAAIAELHQSGQVVRRPVEAPVGSLVVCADHALPFSVRVLDPHDRLLAEIEEPAGFDGDPGPDTVRPRAGWGARLLRRSGRPDR